MLASLRRRSNWLPPLVVTLFALFAAQPLFVDQLTCSDDSAFHIGRAVNLEKLIDTGHFFPRWSPYMAHGYGYPFFNYYAPLSSYLLVALHKLGFIYPAALYIAFFLSLWLAGLAIYALGRAWFGPPAGVVAAVLYITAPYFAYDILFRGNLAESFALIFPPLVLLTLHHALQRKSGSSSAGASLRPTPHSNPQPLADSPLPTLPPPLPTLYAALAFAGLLYTHNATALAAAPFFATYIGVLALLQRNWRTVLRGGLSLVFGLGLAANFWLPALLETNLVQTDKLLVPPIFTYSTNFLSLSELLASPAVVDPLLINPSPAKALGLVAAFLAVAGLAALAYRAPRSAGPSSDRENRPQALGWWLLGCAVAAAALTLSVSQPLWDALPLIKFIQFPWRFLSLAMLCTALLAGAAVHWLPGRPWAAAAALSLVAVAGQISWWYPRYCVPFQETTLASTLRYELDTATLGTTAKGEYLPRTVPGVPEDLSIARALIGGDQPQYLAGLPAGSTSTITAPDPLDYAVDLDLTTGAQLTFEQFFFPGWTAELDGRPLPLTASPESGLITAEVPGGSHRLRLYFGSTPLRLAAAFISLASLVSALTYCLWWIFRRNPAALTTPSAPFQSAGLSGRPTPSAPFQSAGLSGRPTPSAPFQSAGLSGRPLPSVPLAILLLPVLCLLLRPLVLDRTDNPFRHSAFDGGTIGVGKALNLKLASGLSVLSVEYPEAVASGSDFDVNLYLTARQPVAAAYRPRFDLVDPAGLVWNDGNAALPPRWHKEPPETPAWAAGQYAQWSRRETVLPGTPPGIYQLTATIFDRASLAPDSLVDDDGHALSPVAVLGDLRVVRPFTPPGLSDLDIQYPADYDFGPLTLLGYNLDRAEARPGERVLLTLFFRGDEPMSVGHQFNLLDPAYPTNEWQPGDIWRFQTLARVPPEVGTGPYHFRLVPTTLPAPPFELASIQITAPERSFTPPAIADRISIRFADLIELAGYEISTTGSLNITLLWRALSTPDKDYTAFIHVEDASGRIVAQSDTVPSNWSRPTLGWLKGEYVLDPHVLPKLPAGDYTLYVGLADRLGGARLPTPAGDRPRLGVYKAP